MGAATDSNDGDGTYYSAANGAAGATQGEASDEVRFSNMAALEDEESVKRRYAAGACDGAGVDSELVHVERLALNWDHPPKEDWLGKQKEKLKKKYAKYGPLDWLAVLLPCVGWLRIYDWRGFLLADVVAGISVGCMVIPQSISYATIAGLPAVFGLYTALAPVLAYSVFGSSRQLAVGPVAVVSLLLAVGLQKIVPVVNDDPNNPDDPAAQELYNTLAIQVSFLVGLCYSVVGLVRLGFLTKFLSHSVISGFTSGAAIIIGFSQLKYFMGYNIPKSEHIYESIYHLFKHLNQFVWYEFIMGCSFLIILLAMKQAGKKYKKLSWMRPLGPLTVTVLSILLVWAARLDVSPGVKIVGHIPAGLPPMTVDLWFPMPYFEALMPVAITMTAVGLMESIAIAKALAEKNKYSIDPDQELLGLGVSNLVGAMFGAYPCTGSFSRSAVANDIGAKSGLAGGVTGAIVLLALLFITPIFEWMPFNALAAIVISGVIGLVEVHEAVFLFRVAKLDFLVWVFSFAGTLLLGVETGLIIAVGLALLIVIYQSAFPHTAVLGRIPRTNVYRNVKQYPDAATIDGILLIRIDSPIYFANVAYLKERLNKYELRAEEEAEMQGSKVRFVIIDMSPVSHIDASAVHALVDINAAYRKRDVQLVLSNPAKQVQAMMTRAGLHEEIGVENIHVRMHDAVKACSHRLLGLVSRRSTVDKTDSLEYSQNTLATLTQLTASEYTSITLDNPSPAAEQAL